MIAEEHRHVKQLLTKAEQAHRLFSQTERERRECLTCVMFLRALGVPVAAEDLRWVPDGQDPPDARFQDACFEVCERLDKGRRRHDEVKADIQRYRQAKTFDVVQVDRFHYCPMAYDEVYAHLLEALAGKASRYGPKGCAKLDALVYMQLVSRSLLPSSPLPDNTALRQQGWRSVSFLMASSSHVVYATETAPVFLREYMGQTRWQWEPDSTFFSL
jgi:Putative endonuclease, protein of unknown function (DUF1780)